MDEQLLEYEEREGTQPSRNDSTFGGLFLFGFMLLFGVGILFGRGFLKSYFLSVELENSKTTTVKEVNAETLAEEDFYNSRMSPIQQTSSRGPRFQPR